jgi:hypothetical protein
MWLSTLRRKVGRTGGQDWWAGPGVCPGHAQKPPLIGAGADKFNHDIVIVTMFIFRTQQGQALQQLILLIVLTKRCTILARNHRTLSARTVFVGPGKEKICERVGKTSGLQRLYANTGSTMLFTHLSLLQSLVRRTLAR